MVVLVARGRRRSRGSMRGEVEKEREKKDDGRYIIFYTFEDDETGKGPPEGEGENG